MKQSAFENLVTQLQAGDTRCLKFIFEEHADFCIANLKRSGASHESANDIFVDAVLNFRQKILNGQITYLTNIRNYLYSTCRNMFMEQLRSEQKAVSKREEVVMFFQPTSTDPDVEIKDMQLYEEKMMSISMLAFKKLGGNCQKLLDFFYVHKKNMSEIAEIMGLSSANVAKSTKSRCFKKWGDLVNDIKKEMEKNDEL